MVFVQSPHTIHTKCQKELESYCTKNRKRSPKKRKKTHLERISLFRAIRNPFDGELANFECYVRLSFGISFTDLFNIYIYELLYAFMVIFGQMH